ncbi:long-chain-fatty-acid--CoA ligase [Candidatus Marinamargulisbacteria bacterium SCGC AG-343-D04]|nr:long-chain-fatty-acid--CoA ligase [Candidatus Marinamargulisbacteria bacterium SCGC AG-343-D04]
MEHIWLKHYPKGVPTTINPDAFHSIMDVFEQSVSSFADRPAYTSMGVSLTYKEVDTLSKHFAGYLQNHLNMEKGQRLALMMPNLLQYPIALFGAMRAGITIVNVNPLYTPRELTHQLNDSGTTAIVILENFAHTLDACIQNTPIKHVITTEIGDLFPNPKRFIVNSVVKYIKKMVPAHNLTGTTCFNKVLKKGKRRLFHPVTLNTHDIAFLQYTGGTTGVSKGAALTHRNMLANMQQADAWTSFEPGKETIVTALPLYHIFALTANGLIMMRNGGCNLLITNPRDIPLFIKTLMKQKFTAITGVNTLFNALMNHPSFSKIDFSSLKLSLGGGMAVQQDVAKRWKELTGCVLAEAYGLTEASPAVCINPLDGRDFNGSIGLPLPSTEVKVLDDNGNECPLNKEGDLHVKGPQVMKEYWQRPKETKEILSNDGWLNTGDMAKIDENGYVYIVSRKKDMIIVSGFNVYPNEIEDVTALHEGVLECAAIGIPDEKSGERIKLFIVKKDPSLTRDIILEHCKQNLVDYKCPKEIEFRDELPKTNVGKILHRALRTDDTKDFSKELKKNLDKSASEVSHDQKTQ